MTEHDYIIREEDKQAFEDWIEEVHYTWIYNREYLEGGDLDFQVAALMLHLFLTQKERVKTRELMHVIGDERVKKSSFKSDFIALLKKHGIDMIHVGGETEMGTRKGYVCATFYRGKEIVFDIEKDDVKESSFWNFSIGEIESMPENPE